MQKQICIIDKISTQYNIQVKEKSKKSGQWYFYRKLLDVLVKENKLDRNFLRALKICGEKE